ncbi:hypothetical protein CR152_03800 [Massilia violaceinigra]|uniref:Uncharacterized protein n=1 Tax=Massilia violaceinigra TaxID=2045208 RepID=A0A2D2DFH0_9BURK|nr:hypothetical protein [Massilia violaceinigra]ATQ73731.1 hypothetical protein CR152_03800 [Massilia violaceinigra]
MPYRSLRQRVHALSTQSAAIAAVLMLACAPQSAVAAGPFPGAADRYLPLTLNAGPAASSVPLRTGIPFPIGTLKSVANLRLDTGDGSREVDAQFDALATWPDGSVKVALLNVVADVGNATSFRVAYGPGVSRKPLARPLSVTGAAGADLTVDTGPLKFVLNRQGMIGALWRDADGNGRFDSDEHVIDGGDLVMLNAFDNRDYTASGARDAVVSVEEIGPVRVVLKAQGSLTDASGTVLMKYLVRYYASRGSDKVDIETTVIDDRLEPNVELRAPALAIAAKALRMRWNYRSDSAAGYRFGGDNGSVYAGTVRGEHYLSQAGKFTARTDATSELKNSYEFGYSGVGSGSKAPGWVAVDTGKRHMMLMVRDFWQQFPNELNINGNVITAALFPERSVGAAADLAMPAQSGDVYKRPNTLYFHRQGGAKTYQLRLAFGDAAAASTVLASMNDSYQRHSIDLLAERAWYAQSRVFGEIDVGSPSTATTGYDASLMRDIYLPSFNHPPEAGKVGNSYGWHDFGARRRPGWTRVENGVRIPGFYNDTHVGSNNFFKQFLRTGDQRWFGMADIATRNFMDIGVHHGPRSGYWNGHMGGRQQPAGELNSEMHDTADTDGRSLHWGHAHVSGLSDLYLLTGDKRARDVLEEIAGWWKAVTPHFFKLPFSAGSEYSLPGKAGNYKPALYREAERDFGWPLYVMNEYVRVTGNSDCHRSVSAHLANYLVQWWQTPLWNIGFNPATGVASNAVIGLNDARNGTGYWTMSKMDNHEGSIATGTNPWMAGALISSVIQFYEQDKQFAAVGKASGVRHDQLKDMLFQGMNYVVKHGYDKTNQAFYYSEMRRVPRSGGADHDHHIVYGLAYLDRLYKQELAAGRIAHPQWYDTQPLWGTMATRTYQQLKNKPAGKGSQSSGFYGYEMIYPVDFFQIMGASAVR